MKALFRQNMMLVVSVALPLLVVIMFAAASILPRLYTAPPEHDLILAYDTRGVTRREAPFNVQLSVVDNRVVARVSKAKESSHGSIPRIYRYTHETKSFHEISVPFTEGTYQLSAGAVIPIPELEAVRVTSDLRAPDGYEFRGNESDSGFLSELFGGGNNLNSVTIAKDGAIVRLRLPTTDSLYRRYNIKFIGWVID
ncbi:MAG: hypothetical protein HRT77_13890 [Halioglobus sp.]|nr:hypothetical protein [Halioglobus sp.]